MAMGPTTHGVLPSIHHEKQFKYLNLDLNTDDKVVHVCPDNGVVTFVSAKGVVLMNCKIIQKDLKSKLPEKHRCLRVWPFGPNGSLVAELEHNETQIVTYWLKETDIDKI